MKKTHNYLKNFYILLFIIIVFNIFYSNNKVLSNNYLMEKDHLILDLKNNIFWIRCSVGQVWKNNTCEGKAIKLTMDQVEQATTKANEQLGGDWRLPTRKELESIVCFECGKVKINSKFFPHTPYEPFWTGEKNSWYKNFFGQSIFLLDILLEDFLEIFPITSDLLEIDNFFKYW